VQAKPNPRGIYATLKEATANKHMPKGETDVEEGKVRTGGGGVKSDEESDDEGGPDIDNSFYWTAEDDTWTDVMLHFGIEDDERQKLYFKWLKEEFFFFLSEGQLGRILSQVESWRVTWGEAGAVGAALLDPCSGTANEATPVSRTVTTQPLSDTDNLSPLVPPSLPAAVVAAAPSPTAPTPPSRRWPRTRAQPSATSSLKPRRRCVGVALMECRNCDVS
jgi:hypothetical protein